MVSLLILLQCWRLQLKRWWHLKWHRHTRRCKGLHLLRHLQGQYRARQRTARHASGSDRSAGRARQYGPSRQCRSRPWPAMPLLRRPHDHRRELWAWRRTPRPAIARSRGQGHDPMTPITASLHLPPAGKPRFRRRIAVAPPPPTARPMPSIRLKSPVDRRRSAKLATAVVDPLPITPANGSPAPSRRPVKSP